MAESDRGGHDPLSEWIENRDLGGCVTATADDDRRVALDREADALA